MASDIYYWLIYSLLAHKTQIKRKEKEIKEKRERTGKRTKTKTKTEKRERTNKMIREERSAKRNPKTKEKGKKNKFFFNIFFLTKVIKIFLNLIKFKKKLP